MQIQEYLSYNKDTGDVIAIKKSGPRSKIGQILGTMNPMGYLTIGFNKKTYKLHRVAWYLHYSKWPEGVLDHINGDKTDNRIENLRDVTQRINTQNTKKFNGGVIYRPKANKWEAAAKIKTKRIYLGLFQSKLEAQQAYKDFINVNQ